MKDIDEKIAEILESKYSGKEITKDDCLKIANDVGQMYLKAVLNGSGPCEFNFEFLYAG